MGQECVADWLEMPALMRTGDCKTWLQTLESPRKETLCLQNVEWIKKHLKFCESQHNAGPASTFHPTRLLDLGADETGVDFRLVQTSGREPGSLLQYAALSYCWGPEQDAKQQLKTLSSNLQQHRERILFNAATRVIQDAVTAARALSIRYLWIDALCIIQDDTNDWRKESGQMGSIYANAYVTMCTLTSISCLEGFLTRPPPINIKFHSKLRPNVQGLYSLRHQRSRDRLDYINMKKIPLYIEDHDLNCAGNWSKRAWTLQEQHLSRRRLYFGHSRVYLHCSQEELSEPLDHCNPGGKYNDSFRDQVLRYKRDRNIELLYHNWEVLIAGYVKRRAMHKTDVFPAISGLARIMAAELEDTYVAGLWKNDLPRGLLWTACRGPDDWNTLLCRLAPGPSKQYIAPSWSWASIGHAYDWSVFTAHATFINADNMVDHGVETLFRSECCIAAVWCDPVSAESDVYGHITHGELHVEGKLKGCGSSWVRDPRPNAFFERWTIVGDTSAAACAIDFSVPAETKEIQLNNVSLLLLSSSCGYSDEWPRRRHYEKALGSIDGSETDSIRLTYLKMSKKLENIRDDEEDYNEETEQGMDADEDSDDSSSRSSGSTSNSFTPRQRAKQRNAWGLLVYPLTGTDKFVRVGVFRISFEQGGLRCFNDVPVSLVKLV
jgi:hypothetical protein